MWIIRWNQIVKRVKQPIQIAVSSLKHVDSRVKLNQQVFTERISQIEVSVGVNSISKFIIFI